MWRSIFVMNQTSQINQSINQSKSNNPYFTETWNQKHKFHCWRSNLYSLWMEKSHPYRKAISNEQLSSLKWNEILICRMYQRCTTFTPTHTTDVRTFSKKWVRTQYIRGACICWFFTIFYCHSFAFFQIEPHRVALVGLDFVKLRRFLSLFVFALGK